MGPSFTRVGSGDPNSGPHACGPLTTQTMASGLPPLIYFGHIYPTNLSYLSLSSEVLFLPTSSFFIFKSFEANPLTFMSLWVIFIRVPSKRTKEGPAAEACFYSKPKVSIHRSQSQAQTSGPRPLATVVPDYSRESSFWHSLRLSRRRRTGRRWVLRQRSPLQQKVA